MLENCLLVKPKSHQVKKAISIELVRGKLQNKNIKTIALINHEGPLRKHNWEKKAQNKIYKV